MVQGGTISGTVTGSDGAPVANANVRAASGDAENGATTQSDGSYSINLLPPGSYRVSASGYNPAIVRTYYAATPGETRASQATPVVLATGGAVGDIAIHASTRGTAPATIVATAAHRPSWASRSPSTSRCPEARASRRAPCGWATPLRRRSTSPMRTSTRRDTPR